MAIPALRIVTDDVCVALDTFAVHSEGVHAQLRITHRNPIYGGSDSRAHTFYVHPTDGLFPNQDVWRLGLEFSDGRMAFTPNNMAQTWTDDFIFHINGGGGDQLLELHRVYISPVPPPGLMHLHLAFPDGAVHSASADCTRLSFASNEVARIWDN